MTKKKEIKYVCLRLEPEFYWRLKEISAKMEMGIQEYVVKCLDDRIWIDEKVRRNDRN